MGMERERKRKSERMQRGRETEIDARIHALYIYMRVRIYEGGTHALDMNVPDQRFDFFI